MRVCLDSSALIKRALRSLDAIHLATATLVGAVIVCAYDQRMLAAAAELGFRTISPEA